MAIYTFIATLDPNGSPTVLTNVVNIDIQAGRQAQIDNFSSARATITVRYPNGYVSPLASAVIGTEILIEGERSDGGYTTTLMWGVISDVVVQYGIPYASSVGNADYLILSVETLFAKLARTSGDGYAMASDTATNQLQDALLESGVAIAGYPGAYFASRTLAATTISGSWADWLNTMAFTFGGRITEGNDFLTITNYQPAAVNTTITLSDTGAALTAPYDALSFDSLGQNYYTEVVIDPPSVASQTASTGSAPFRNFTTQTLNSTTGQALDLANYYLGNYSTPSLALSSVHLNLNVSEVMNFVSQVCALPAIEGSGIFGQGTQINVAFRGTTYACVIEGGALSATPEQASLTLYVSGAGLNAYLILNNATFGKLNSNRLGF